MSLRTALLPALDTIRGILGPGALDMRPTSVSIVTRTWSGPQWGQGTPQDTTLSLPPSVKVRHVTQREIATSGGRIEQGDVMATLITPAFTRSDGTTGGFTEAQIDPAGLFTPGTTGVGARYVLAPQAGATGIAGEYALIDFQRDRNFHFNLVLRRLETTP